MTLFSLNYRRPTTKINRSRKSGCDEADISYGSKVQNGLTCHDFRRTFKSNMLRSGVDKIHRDIIVKHALEGWIIFYMNPSEDDLKMVIEKFTTWFDNLLTTSENVDQHVDQA